MAVPDKTQDSDIVQDTGEASSQENEEGREEGNSMRSRYKDLARALPYRNA